MRNDLSEIQNKINYCKDNNFVRTKDISDGYHTFGDLYHHRAVLFSMVCNLLKDNAWKSRLHDDGTMFDKDMFITGITTPEGQYTYHYHMEYWDMYDVKELVKAPHYDGHKPEDIDRLLSLLGTNQNTHVYCSNCVNGKELFDAIILNSRRIPKDCDECHPWNPEDSFPLKERPRYKEINT